MRTKMLRIIVRQATQLFTPTKSVVEMMRIPVITPMAIEVRWVCIRRMMRRRLKQQEKPRRNRIRYCQADRGDVFRKGYSQAEAISRQRLSWLQMAQGEFFERLFKRVAITPKSTLGANLMAYSGEVHSIVIDPAMITPNMMRQKHPCLPAKDSYMIANIIPPEAFQPYIRHRNIAIDISHAANFNLLSCSAVGRKGMSLFFLRMKTRLQRNVTSIVTNTNWMGGIASCLAMEKLIQSRMGPRSMRETGENYISGQSANYLYSYSWMSVGGALEGSYPAILDRAWAILRDIARQNLENTVVFDGQALGFGRRGVRDREAWKELLKASLSSEKDDERFFLGVAMMFIIKQQQIQAFFITRWILIEYLWLFFPKVYFFCSVH